ncbi:MAG: hypothetical protein ACOWYE_06550, partial [Desulfatiglandales bacterium]
GKKVFTAARIPEKGRLEGYLYVILGGQAYYSIADKLQGSYILRLSAWMIGASLFFALAAGLILFALLTGRLKRLARAVTAYNVEDTLMLSSLARRVGLNKGMRSTGWPYPFRIWRNASRIRWSDCGSRKPCGAS